MAQFVEPWEVVALLCFAVWFLHDKERSWHRPLTYGMLAFGLAYALIA